jgi:hypothetical protein
MSNQVATPCPNPKCTNRVHKLLGHVERDGYTIGYQAACLQCGRLWVEITQSEPRDD